MLDRERDVRSTPDPIYRFFLGKTVCELVSLRVDCNLASSRRNVAYPVTMIQPYTPVYIE